MSWVRIDDHFYDHPRWVDAPGDSIALWLAAMAWCNRNDSFGGFIPAVKLGGLVNVRNVKATTKDLVDRGAFSQQLNGYFITSYEEYQQNERVKAIREERRKAGKKGADARWGTKSDGNEDGNCHGNTMATEMPHHPPPVDGEEQDFSTHGKSRLDETADAYGQKAFENAVKSGRAIGDPIRYKRKVATEAKGNPELRRLLDLFPTAPASVIVAALYGDKGALRYYDRADEMADVHELRPA
jgi:uncharacterized protein YbjQ (UPF0145 family)